MTDPYRWWQVVFAVVIALGAVAIIAEWNP